MRSHRVISYRLFVIGEEEFGGAGIGIVGRTRRLPCFYSVRIDLRY